MSVCGASQMVRQSQACWDVRLSGQDWNGNPTKPEGPGGDFNPDSSKTSDNKINLFQWIHISNHYGEYFKYIMSIIPNEIRNTHMHIRDLGESRPPLRKKKKEREQKFYGTPVIHWAEGNVLVRNADSVEYKTQLTQGDYKRQKYRDGQSIKANANWQPQTAAVLILVYDRSNADWKGLIYAKGQSSQGPFSSYECTSNDTAVTYRAGPAGDARRNRNILISGHVTHHAQAKGKTKR